MTQMIRRAVAPLAVLLLPLILGACVHSVESTESGRVATTQLEVIAFNDFHGHISASDQSLFPPGSPAGTPRMKAGGAVNFAAAVAKLRAENPNNVVVSAGDMIGASPLVSGHFLDEPTIRAMNAVGVDFNALGNHEFDRGQPELARIQNGGCAKFTLLEPCQVMPDFPGAKFRLLAANTLKADGTSLFQPYGIKTLTIGGKTVKVGFVGLTLKGAPGIVSPTAITGLHFADEAETANALIPTLRAQGADILAILVHEGGYPPKTGDAGDCANLTGDLNKILAKLDPAFDLVISGHTHVAYICNYQTGVPERSFLVTSAGLYGMQMTRITLDYDLVGHKLLAKQAQNIVVTQSPEAATEQPEIASLVSRYEAGIADVRERPVGRIGGPLGMEEGPNGQSSLGNFIADAQRAAMAAPDKGGAQIGFMNAGGVRASIKPAADGAITFGDVYAAQPFGNVVVAKSLTGAQIKAALEQQFARNGDPMILDVSEGFAFAYDENRPAGSHVFDVTLNGKPLVDGQTYSVAMSNFMATGGDSFTAFGAGTQIAEGPSDLDALITYIASQPGRQPAPVDRARNATPK